MRLIPEFKAHCMCFIVGSLSLCSNAVADSITILVDAAQGQRTLQTVSDVALNVARSAGNNHSVGLVVYEEVFQRSAELGKADESQVQRISEVLGKITPTEFSNIAVGIEKGISELNTDGGVLLVLGNSDIQLADIEADSKYREWLQTVLLPDAANKAITIILASPQSAQSNVVDAIIEEYPNNRIISYNDTVELVDQLSELLPFPLSDISPIAEAPLSDAPPTSTQDIPLEPDQGTATPPVATKDAMQSEPQGRFGVSDYVLLAIMTLVFMTMVMISLLLKRRHSRNNQVKRPDDTIATATQPTRRRYLAPKQGLSAVLATRVAEKGLKPSTGRLQSDELQSVSGSSGIEQSIVTTSELGKDDLQFDPDITAPRESIRFAETRQYAEPKTTARHKAISPDKTTASSEDEAVDELEELKNLTKQKQLSQV